MGYDRRGQTRPKHESFLARNILRKERTRIRKMEFPGGGNLKRGWIIVGDLVRFHDSNSKKRTLGVVTDQRFDNPKIKDGVVFFSVLWNTGLISEHPRWQLFKVETNESR